MERLYKEITLSSALRPSDLLRLLQDIAGEDADRRNGGQAVLRAVGCTWVLVKNRVEVIRWPQASETVRLTTWPLEGRLGLYPRCYALSDAEGRIIVSADSIWAIMDVETRTMIQGESRGISMLGVETDKIRPQRRIKMPEGGELYDLSPAEAQIDSNGHMNNAAYLDAVETMLPAAFQGKQALVMLIEYVHEILPNRHAQVRVVSEGESCYFEGSMEGKTCFRLREDFAV